MSTAWVVMGTTGEYADRCYWVSAVFTNEVEAQEHISKLHRTYYENLDEDEDGGSHHWWEDSELYRLMKELDPKFKHDYPGTQYYAEEVPFYG